MSHHFRLTMDDCDDIGFAMDALYSGALTYPEFRQWLLYVIENHDELPPLYIFDMASITDRDEFLASALPEFAACWDSTRAEDRALTGIGYDRFPGFKADDVTRPTALRNLANNPHIADRFRAAFPFVEW